MHLLRVWSLAAGLLSAFAHARDDLPKVQRSDLENIPEILFYFDDSSVILTLDGKAGNVWRSDDDGNNWAKVKDVPEGEAWNMVDHPFDNKRAFILGLEKTHWSTRDAGKTWQKFKAEHPTSYMQFPLAFHAKKPDYILYAGRICAEEDYLGFNCEEVAYYTKDGFDSDMKLLRENTHSCMFARGTEVFTEAQDYTILCIINGKDRYPEHRKLVVTNNFFESEKEPELNGYSTVDGLAGIVGVQKFIVAAVRSKGTDEMALFVTDDTVIWDRAEFPHDHGGLKEDAYTILESTPYSIQVDVLTTKPTNPMGSLFTSNSNGTYFTRNLENTNRVLEGFLDFEQVQNIQGIILANIVKNADDIARGSSTQKKVISRISFDDGKFDTWKPLKTKDDKELHLYSVTALANGGRVYSSPAPGLLMGVGSVGSYLEPYTDCDLFLSDDGGLIWERVRENAHKYEFGGSGSVVVAVNDEEATDKLYYSLNHGGKWDSVDLGKTVRARLLTTTPDSTSLRFILIGTDKEHKAYTFAIDFSDVFDRKCELKKDDKNGDYERWCARRDENGKPDCLMGHKQFFWRRKKDAKCYVGDLYKDPEPEQEVCECTDQDFECDFNYVRKGGRKEDECVPAEGAKFAVPSGECKKPEDKFMGTSGYRKIPGNNCKGGKALDEKVEKTCDKVDAAPPSSGVITTTKTSFKGASVAEYFYLENSESSSQNDETIIMRTKGQEVWITHNGGRTWEQILKNVDVVSIYPNPHNFASVYFITPIDEVYYTLDRGLTPPKKMRFVPNKPNRQNLQVLDFHPRNKEWLIWTGQQDCESPKGCHAVAHYTKDNGDKWTRLLPYVGLCKWVRRNKQSEKLIFCEHDEKEDGSGNLQLLASDTFFEDRKEHFPDIIGFATMAEFIVVASVNEDGTSLKASTSTDGSIFAEAKFPHNFNVPHQTAYTVLDSITHSVFLHVTVNPKKGYEFGSLLKSNSNGTDYVLSLEAVNRNERGYVDFEKMHSLEGVAIANQLINPDRALDGERKKLRSMITHNDGATWELIKVAGEDSEGRKFPCDIGKPKECSLHLHHYTERTDPRDTFASGSAVGLMMGVGNVGNILTGYADGNTFLTTDGGMKWKEVKKGQYMWEYGDQGSIIVIVNVMSATNKVFYTLNEGETWNPYPFADEDEKVIVSDISTLPSDTSRKFLLWGKREGGGDNFWTIQLDFTKVTNIECELKEGKEAESDDFELWSPEHPSGGCLFGHIAQYQRKITSHNCYIGRKIKQPHRKLKDCECTRQDYECDYNYERQNGGTCALVPGLLPPDHKAVCSQDHTLVEWWEPNGYRRLPMTTCDGGDEKDKRISHPCPGHEEEYRRKRGGAHGFGLFLAIVIPIAAAFAIGWYVWTKLFDRGFGAIRLGDERGGQNPIVEYSVIVVSAIVAVIMTIPPALSIIGRWVADKFRRTRTRTYNSRQSFARGPDYTVVNNDEGELLGGSDDDDEF